MSQNMSPEFLSVHALPQSYGNMLPARLKEIKKQLVLHITLLKPPHTHTPLYRYSAIVHKTPMHPPLVVLR